MLAEIERWGLWPHFQAEEAEFLRKEDADVTALSAWIWHQEGCFALMWALGLLDSLDPSSPDSAGQRLERLFSFDGIDALASAVRIRPVEEILDEEDYYALYQAAYEPIIPPGTALGMEPEVGPLPAPVVSQRLRALTWLFSK